jgi:DNA-binding transcriptional LysR family regulator
LIGLKHSRGLRFRAIASYETLVAPWLFIGMTEGSYPNYREWLMKTGRAAGFTPKVLQDVTLERTMIQTVAAGLGVALVPEQLKKLPHDNVVFRPIKPSVKTEGCVAWKGDELAPSLKTYLEIVEHIARNGNGQAA